MTRIWIWIAAVSIAWKRFWCFHCWHRSSTAIETALVLNLPPLRIPDNLEACCKCHTVREHIRQRGSYTPCSRFTPFIPKPPQGGTGAR